MCVKERATPYWALPIVGVQSADQLPQLRFRIGPETRDNAVKGAHQGQDRRQVGPQKSGPTPGTHERHGRERAQPRERDHRDLKGGAPCNLEHPDPLPSMHCIREDRPRLRSGKMVEPSKHRAQPVQLGGNGPRIDAHHLIPVRIQICQQHRHSDLRGEPPPRASGTGAEVDDPARLCAQDGAPQDRTHGVVRTREVDRKGKKIGQRVPQRRRTRGEIVDLDEMQSHQGKVRFRAR